MRKKFELQCKLGVQPIEEIKIPIKRDELAPVLKALQHIFVSPDLNSKVFAILESKINVQKNGRPGLSLWEILVLAVVRLTLDANYDRLEDMANNHILIRKLLGVETFGGEGKLFPHQTLIDNVSLLDEKTLNQINEIIIKEVQDLKKKIKMKV